MNTLREFVEYKLTHCDKTAEANGYPLTMQNCKKNKKMRQLELYGNSVQDGTPTPDAPIDVVSVGEKSVNLFDKDKAENGTIVSETGINQDIVNRARTSYMYLVAGSYVCSMKNGIQTGAYIHTYSEANENSWIKYIVAKRTVTDGKCVTTFTLQSDCYVRFAFIPIDSTVVTNLDTEFISQCDIMLTEGSTATPYEPFGKYKIPVVMRGKNLIDIDMGLVKETTTSGYTSLAKNLDGTYTLNMTNSSRSSDFIPFNIPKGAQVTFSVNIKENDSGDLIVLFYNKNGALIKEVRCWGVRSGNYKDTFTTTDDLVNIRVTMLYDSIAGTHITFENIQIEYGNTVTPYEPYVEPITTNIFLDEPLRKLGDYADYIDFKENKVVRKCVKKYLKDYDWLEYRTLTDGDGVHYDLYCNDNSIIPSMINQVNLWSPAIAKSNIFPIYATYENDKIHFGIILWTWTMNVRVNFPQEYCADTSNVIASFKAWLNEYNPYMVRVLAEPVIESLNIDLPKLNAKTSIIEVDTSILPANAYGKYILK